jgi:hypothetical protein
MGVSTAIQGWYQHIAPLRDQGYYIRVSPAPTSTDTGVNFIRDFLNGLDAPNYPTHVGMHWYGTTFAGFQEWVNKFRAVSKGLPLMITEFACQDFGIMRGCDMGEVWNFVNQAIPWMNDQGDIAAYAPFGASYVSLV